MKKFYTILPLLLFLYSCQQQPASEVNAGEKVVLAKSLIQDKIKGGWAGQVIGCTFGGPTEFRFRSTFIPDYQPIAWNDGLMKWWYQNGPGLYDDIYMDLTFVDVFEKEGLDAPAASFANAFANADYSLWHANQAARYNILHGIMPPESGNWLHNPHSEDIDFQIESDFAGLMSPGLINTSAQICDRVGHIMNYGDGWYGGVYVAAMYALAFISDDINYIVNEALREIPEQSLYYQCMHDVISWHREQPDDWKATWLKVERKYGEDVGCPDGVFTTFNIDAKINSAWILLGLLYGDKDFGKTLDIAARSGDDSDCNPASAGGILGAILGYDQIPPLWKAGLADVEPMDFKYTTISLNDVYHLSLKHALENLLKVGASIDGDSVTFTIQQPQPVPLEQGFKDHYPAQRLNINETVEQEKILEFDGVGFSITGQAKKMTNKDEVIEATMTVDDNSEESISFPTDFRQRCETLFWKFQLPNGHHIVKIMVKNPEVKATLQLGDMVVYNNQPAHPKY